MRLFCMQSRSFSSAKFPMSFISNSFHPFRKRKEDEMLHSLAQDPSSAFTDIPKYFKENYGTVEGLHEICNIVSKNFGKLQTVPQFNSLLKLLSEYYLAAHQELFTQTCHYLAKNLAVKDVIAAGWIAALNCATLASINNTEVIEKYILSVFNQILIEMDAIILNDFKKRPLEQKAKLYTSFEYLKRFARHDISFTDNNASIMAYLNKYFEDSKALEQNTETISYGQRRLYEKLNSLRIPYMKEKRLFTYTVDAFVNPKTVIEVLGDVHTFSNTGILRSSTVLKLDFLRRKGYKVIEIRGDKRSKKRLIEAIDDSLLRISLTTKSV